MTDIKLPSLQENTAGVMFHLKNYFDVSLRMNCIPFIVAIFAAPLTLLLLVAPFILLSEPLGYNALGDKLLHWTDQLLNIVATILLIPAFIKRMKDVGWSKVMIRIVCACVALVAGLGIAGVAVIEAEYHPPFPLVTVALGALLTGAGVVLSLSQLCLCGIPGNKGENQYGPAPRK